MLLFFIFVSSLSPWLLLLVIGSVLLDLIDGPLARIMGIASDKGKFIDMLCDNLSFSIFVLGLMYAGLLSGVIGAALIYFMVLSKLLRSIHNSRHYKSNWKFKAVAGFTPNFVVALSYILFGILLVGGIEYLGYAYGLFSAILILDAGFFYVRIVREE
jgi:phosphatidylglycerophosphate synthase